MRRIKSILFPSVLVLVVALGAVPSFAAPPGPTLVDVASAVNSSGPFAEQFDTLIAAVLAADPVVLATLTGNGQFTVFAPTDDAFVALGLTPDNVGDVPQDALTNILLYHVARGRRYAADVLASDRIRTVQGGFVMQDGGVLNGYSSIVVTDVEAANGVVHAIDAVLLPE
jgi:uncharacterized surface protein with fasciclin (FAS1) repeats